jgi:hypothetical protein
MKILNTLTLLACLANPAVAQTTTSTTSTTTTAASSAVDVLGTWDATVTTSQGQAIPSQVKLRKDGDKVVGTIASQMGETPIEAVVKGRTLTISFNFQGQNGPMAIELAGTVNDAGDAIKGTMAVGGQQGGEFVATRAKDASAKEPAKAPSAAAKTDLTGAWSLSLMLETITATPSLTLKQEGEKLTGEYVSQNYGKFPVTGTVKGNDVAFSVPMNIEGNAITAAYTGTIQPDGSLKGSVDLGQMGGTFTASRKK